MCYVLLSSLKSWGEVSNTKDDQKNQSFKFRKTRARAKERFVRFLNNHKSETLTQFIKFGIVGVSNTLISYAIEMLCFYILFSNTEFYALWEALSIINLSVNADTARIWVASFLGFVVSVTNSYYWNSKHVFSDGEKKTISKHIKLYCKTFVCYALTGLVLSPWLKTIITGHGIQYWEASLLVLIITVPINFVMNKFWAFRRGK